MVKAYLRYLFDCSFGIVSSNDINIIYDRAGEPYSFSFS